MLHDIIASISARLLDASPQQGERALRATLEALVEALAAERASVHLLDLDGGSRVHATFAARDQAADGGTVALPVEALPWLRERLERLDAVAVRVGAPLPEAAAAERHFMCRERIVCWLAIPMVERGRVVGVLEMRSRSDGCGWTSQDVVLLRVVADAVLGWLRRERESRSRAGRERLEAIGLAASGVAHDLANLLVVADGYCERLEGSLEDARGAAVELEPGIGQDLAELRTALAHARGIAALTLRATGRSGASRSAPTDTRSDPASRGTAANPALHELSGLVRQIVGPLVALDLSLDPHVEQIAIAPAAFDQVVLNLVANAREAMPRGGRLRVETTQVDVDAEHACALGIAAGPHVRLRIEDDGRGMDAATRRRLFEPFFTTRADAAGTGLGLATVAAIVEDAGGAVEVDSAPGAGTTFEVWLPTPAAGRVVERTRARVLLVERDASLRRWSARALREAGYRVLEVEDAHEATRLLAADTAFVDLVVIDPNEKAASDLVASVEAARSGRRVLFTADPQTQPAGTLPEYGGGLGLARPFTPRTLLRAVRERLDAPDAVTTGRLHIGAAA